MPQSTHSCVVFYGVRIELEPEEIEGVELGIDDRVIAARHAGLDLYWANFGGLHERYLMFVGAEIGVLGPGSVALVESGELTGRMARAARLLKEGFAAPPALHLQWRQAY